MSLTHPHSDPRSRLGRGPSPRGGGGPGMPGHPGPAGRPGRSGPGGGAPAAEQPAAQGLAGWFLGRLPDEWFEGPPEVTVDRDEVLVVGRLSPPEVDAGAGAAAVAEAEAGRIARFRETTRARRMEIAREAEHRFGRKVAWGASVGGTRSLFTTLSVPVMTRLRQPERLVLDTLVEAGVARSRADALAWCVRLVGRNADSWLGELRTALQEVQRLRAQGPTGDAGAGAAAGTGAGGGEDTAAGTDADGS